ncbi:MAG: DEAD/DEAH box helicase [Dehalococcoidia bacterium]|nr:DEAD/DEAH box helicase [Dehalococcoidia bacterium]
MNTTDQKDKRNTMTNRNSGTIAEKKNKASKPASPSKDKRAPRQTPRAASGTGQRRVVEYDHYSRKRRDRSFESPLPEDLAFRPSEEGGDSTLLPEVRHRPRRMRPTERVIESGPRTLGGWTSSNDNFPSPSRPVTKKDSTQNKPHLNSVRSRQQTKPADRSTKDKDEKTEPTPAIQYENVESTTVAEDENVESTTVAEDENVESTTVAEDGKVALFASLGLSDTSLDVMDNLGFIHPTPIQEKTIPGLLEGKDIVGLAETGSGKTIAFGAPMAERIDAELGEVQGIVLVPTRELAQQVLDVMTTLAEPHGLLTVGLLGGRAIKKDIQNLGRSPQVLVGTPGRVQDHLQRGTLNLRKVKFVVLDEADEMLDIGFLPAIRRILSRTPRSRQTALFSATMPTTIKRLIWQFMDDPETFSVDSEGSAAVSVEQTYVEVAERDKVLALKELIEKELKGRSLVFCRTRRMVEKLAKNLSGLGVKVGALHGDMDQRVRDRVVKQFREGALELLIATNVAARGIDIPEITHVVHYDFPQNTEEYIHRTGRTGRAGKTGKSIVFVAEWDLEEFTQFQEELGNTLEKETLALYSSK